MISNKRHQVSYFSKLNYPMFFYSNHKTYGNVSVDFGVCQLMQKRYGSYNAKACKGCYSARLMNVYPMMAKKLQRAGRAIKRVNLKKFEEDIILLKANGMKKIRVYAFGDYAPEHLPLLRVMDRHMKVFVLSKTLACMYKKDFAKLSRVLKNGHISISANDSFGESFVIKCMKFVRKHRLKNVQINYCFFSNDYKKISGIDVYHTIKKDKQELAKVVGTHRTCCLRGKDGKILKKKGDAFCGKCGLCENTKELKKGMVNVKWPIKRKEECVVSHV